MRSPFKLTLMLLVAGTVAQAQQFGGNPPAIKWKQVNTPAVRVIFPTGNDSMGIRVANIIAQMNARIQPTIGYKQRQVSIVMQNQTTISNGYVGLAPFRSEFYMTPDQNNFELGSLRWSDQLAIHEFRHVQQFNNFNVGVSKALRILFGEGGQGVGNALAVPNWFFEGDAVFNETYVTNQGRGRLPYFYNSYRALWAAGKNYSWMKIRNGSYRDYVPDHYPLGYMLVSYGREKYGDDFWKNVTHDAAAFNGLFYPLQRAVKKYAGISFKQFRQDALNYYKQQFNLANKPAVKHKHFVGDYEYPAYVDDNTIIYSKSTYDKPVAFVMRTGNKERVISRRDFSLDNYFDYHAGKIVYSTYRPDVRWGYRDYSELTIVDVNTGDKTHITHKTKYFSPALNDDASKIVAVQVTPDGKNQLHILDLKGKLLTMIPNKGNLFYTYPKFYGDKIVAAVRKADGDMSLALIDALTGDAKFLLAPSIKPIAFPSVRKDMVYFSASNDKTDALFALSLSSKKLYKLQNDTALLGTYQPTVTANKTAWVSFTAYGYQLKERDNSHLQWQQIGGNALPGTLPDYGIKALNKGDAANLLATLTDAKPAVTKYNKAFHLINFHTLAPTFSDPNYTLALQGENVLNTLQMQLLFNYNRNEGYKEFGFGAVYGAWFPYISAGVDYIVDRETYARNSPVYYDQLQYHAGLQIPLTLTKGSTSTSLSFGSDAVYSRNFFSGIYDNATNSRELVYLDSYLSFSSRSRRAKKNIYPAFGQSVSLNYKNAINGVSGNQFLATGDLYFPGLFANHSLVVSGAYQTRDKEDNGGFSNDFPFSRGYTSANLYQMSKLAASYHFPMFYPDFGFGNAVYLSRIRGSVVYEYTHGNDPVRYTIPINHNFRSAGAQVFFDGTLWNQSSVSIGIRYSRLLDQDIFGGRGANRIDIVLPVSIF